MRKALAVALLALLAGCSGPDPAPSLDPVLTAAPTPAPQHTLNVVVTRETADGEPMEARVDLLPVVDGVVAGPMVPKTTVGGVASFSFREPTTVLVRAVGPSGWTTEGARITVGDTVAAEGALASDRDVFLPLFRERLDLAVQQPWSTAIATPGPGGRPAATFAPLDLPEETKAAYLARLVAATVTVTWSDGPDGGAGSLATGLAWDGAAWVVGPESPPGGLLGPRSAAWDGELPAERPADLSTARLQAVLQTGTAVVGDVLFDVQATLVFGDHVPPEIPDVDCHLRLC